MKKLLLLMFMLTTASLAWAEQTDPPEIYSEDTGESVIVHAIGNGYICLYWEDQLVAEGEGEVVWSIPYLEEDYEYFFLATAMEEGKEVSEYTLATIIVPGYSPYKFFEGQIVFGEPTEEGRVAISYTGNEDVTMIVTLNGEVVEVVNGTIQLVDGYNEITVIIQAEGYEDLEANYVYMWTAPAPLPTARPEFSIYDDPEAQTVTVTATGNGHICLYWDDILMADGEGKAVWVIPYVDDSEGVEYYVSATAQEPGKLVSDYAFEFVYIPGKTDEPHEPYQTPAPEITTELTDDALVITATGEGIVVLHVQYIDNETGEMTTETYTGEGTVTVPVARGEVDAYINYWATAQANEDALIGTSEVEYFVEVPALEGGPGPEDPHMTGWWIVLIDKNGEEVWYELHEGTDGSWVTTLSLGTDYGIYYYGQSMASRPKVPFRFVLDGVAWGAEEDGMATLMGTIMDNPLFETDAEINYYTVPVGYSYGLGIYVDPSEDDQLNDGTWYYVYCIQGPEIPGVDPPVVDTERGDVDMDGEVGIADVVALIDYILSHDDTGISLENADCDMDGDIGIADVVALIDYILSKTW